MRNWKSAITFFGLLFAECAIIGLMTLACTGVNALAEPTRAFGTVITGTPIGGYAVSDSDFISVQCQGHPSENVYTGVGFTLNMKTQMVETLSFRNQKIGVPFTKTESTISWKFKGIAGYVEYTLDRFTLGLTEDRALLTGKDPKEKKYVHAFQSYNCEIEKRKI